MEDKPAQQYLSLAFRLAEINPFDYHIPDELSAAILWAMDKWLERHNKKPTGNWSETDRVFKESCPALTPEILRIQADLFMLRAHVHGPDEYINVNMVPEQYKEDLNKCLTDAEKIIAAIEAAP